MSAHDTVPIPIPPVFDFVRYKDDSGSTHALRKRGRKHFHLVIIGHPIYVLKVLIAGANNITPLVRDLGSVVAKFTDAVRRCGITEGARLILEEARNGN